jgi:hypothetical protein
MSPVMRALRVAAALTLVLAAAAGCTKNRSGNPFDPDTGHAADWVVGHRAAFVAGGAACLECHGTDMMGGISHVSCFSASFEGQSCHPGGPRGGHPAGWSSPSSHGAGAKAENGFPFCEDCHGGDFRGGTAGLSCFGCHGVPAPHPRAPWRGALTHTSTNPSNAIVCAQCHRNSKPGNPGCFNDTLCHAEPAGHPPGWAAASSHGAAAKAAPGTMRGFAVCEGCHGSNFGGSSGPSCFGCHGWNAPHARNGWQGGGTSHRSTDQSNASVCAQCHRSSSGAPGCFNATLCHGTGGGHPAGWASSGQHGAAALGSPGFTNCQGCHGAKFAGGTGPTCLSTGTCHRWNAAHGKTGWQGGGGTHRRQRGWEGICRLYHPNGCTTCHGSD